MNYYSKFNYIEHTLKEVWWSRGSVPACGPPGPRSNLSPGPLHDVS